MTQLQLIFITAGKAAAKKSPACFQKEASDAYQQLKLNQNDEQKSCASVIETRTLSRQSVKKYGVKLFTSIKNKVYTGMHSYFLIINQYPTYLTSCLP